MVVRVCRACELFLLLARRSGSYVWERGRTQWGCGGHALCGLVRARAQRGPRRRDPTDVFWPRPAPVFVASRECMRFEGAQRHPYGSSALGCAHACCMSTARRKHARACARASVRASVYVCVCVRASVCRARGFARVLMRTGMCAHKPCACV